MINARTIPAQPPPIHSSGKLKLSMGNKACKGFVSESLLGSQPAMVQSLIFELPCPSSLLSFTFRPGWQAACRVFEYRHMLKE